MGHQLTLPAPEVWRLYRHKADSENRIGEFKYEFGVNGFCLRQFYATESAFRPVMTAYNLVSLFRQRLCWELNQKLIDRDLARIV